MEFKPFFTLTVTRRFEDYGAAIAAAREAQAGDFDRVKLSATEMQPVTREIRIDSPSMGEQIARIKPKR